MARCIKLMPDYGCHPLWTYAADGDLQDNPNPLELPLSPGVVAALQAWANWYDSFLDPDQPQYVRLIPPDEYAAFRQTGQQLWARLQSELGPAWRVVYFEDGKVLDLAADGSPTNDTDEAS
jgi:hypothetical protein